MDYSLDEAVANGPNYKQNLDVDFSKAKEAIFFDHDKTDYSLLPVGPLEEIAKVLTFGKRKYTAYNWCKGSKWSRPAASALRHIYAWLRGQKVDPETGLHPLAHACCRLMMLIEFEQTNTGTDDRYKGQPSKADNHE